MADQDTEPVPTTTAEEVPATTEDQPPADDLELDPSGDPSAAAGAGLASDDDGGAGVVSDGGADADFVSSGDEAAAGDKPKKKKGSKKGTKDGAAPKKKKRSASVASGSVRSRSASVASGSVRSGSRAGGSKVRAPSALKKKVAKAAAHIPKRSLSFGRSLVAAQEEEEQQSASQHAQRSGTAEPLPTTPRSTNPESPRGTDTAAAESPRPAADSQLEGEQGGQAPTVTLIEKSPSQQLRESSPAVVGGHTKKPTLRLFGEVAEATEDPQTRATHLFNIGYMYGTGLTDVPVSVDKAYAYFYHAAKEDHVLARYNMALLQVGRTIGAAPVFTPASLSAKKAGSPKRGRSNSRATSPARGASPSPAAATGGGGGGGTKKGKKGPFGGLVKAVENLTICMEEHKLAEAAHMLGILNDPDYPTPAGWVHPPTAEEAAAIAAEKEKAAASGAAKRGEKAAATPTTPTSPKKAADGSGEGTAGEGEEKPPLLDRRNYDRALQFYTKAAELGHSMSQPRVQDIETQQAEEAHRAKLLEDRQRTRIEKTKAFYHNTHK